MSEAQHIYIHVHLDIFFLFPLLIFYIVVNEKTQRKRERVTFFSVLMEKSTDAIVIEVEIVVNRSEIDSSLKIRFSFFFTNNNTYLFDCN